MSISFRLSLIIIFLTGLFGQFAPVKGQSGSVVISGPVEVDHFPTIRFYLDVWNAEGNFASDLKTEDIEIVENGQALPAKSIVVEKTGLQVIVALNPSAALATQVGGISEYARLVQGLSGWAQSQPADTLDDFSLSTPTGLFAIRTRNPQEFKQALTEYQPDLAKAQPSLNSISQALDLATDPLGRPLMKRSILFITAALPAVQAATLPDLAIRAQEIGVQVNVWLVGQAAASTEGVQDPLEQFAISSGGKFSRIIPSAPLPEIEPVFQPLRQTYAVQYQSAIKKSGANRLSVKVLPEGAQSAEQHFDLRVDPPNPIFLSPPAQVERSWEKTGVNKETYDLKPDTVSLQILIEFPDQHPRAIKATRLYVNGELVAENTTEPFDRFDWSIVDVESPTRSLLRVEVVDEIELNGTSSEIPVDILVDQPVKTSVLSRLSERGLIAILAMFASGMVLVLILTLTNTQRRLRWKRQKADKKLEKDPVTQPVPVKPVSTLRRRFGFSRKRKKEPRPAALPRPSAPGAPARLVALDENEQPVTGGSIPLTYQEITFGSDPKRATHWINSPTVDGLHARLYYNVGEGFFLADQDSTAGTWINYAPVTPAGAHLEHDDLIHIGKVLFRFELMDPSMIQPSKVKIVDLGQANGAQ